MQPQKKAAFFIYNGQKLILQNLFNHFPFFL